MMKKNSNALALLALLSVLLPVQVLEASGPHCSYCAVQNLIAEPDYRAVKLNWRYLHAQEPPGFRISFCEVSIWNSKLRCRQKYLPLAGAMQSKWLQKLAPSLQYLDKLLRIERGTYQASVYDLRMLTNYTFSVEADFSLHFNSDHPSGSDMFNKFGIHANNPLNVNEARTKRYNVTVETKSFSGKTILCLSNASEVIVHTGPFFNGKIAVENAPDEGCAVFGNHSDPLDTYTLTIHHNRCGSQIIENSRIETMIIVHENKEILTHNSRRFLVVCNFPPETYTLKASVEVPPHLLKRKKPKEQAGHGGGGSADQEHHRSSFGSTRGRADSDPNHINIFDTVKVNNVHDSRILALHQEHKILSNSERSEASLLSSMIGCASFVAILISFLIVFIWYASKESKAAASEAKTSKCSHKTTKERPSCAVHAFSRSPPLTVSSVVSSGESYA